MIKMKFTAVFPYLVLCAVVASEEAVKPEGIPSDIKKLVEGNNLNNVDLAETIHTLINGTLFVRKDITRNISALVDARGCNCHPPNKTKKYFIVKQKGNWYHALTYCRHKKMDLATIRSEEENALFNKTLEAEVPLRVPMAVWIGGTDMHSWQHFYWFNDGQPFVYSYTNWFKQSGAPYGTIDDNVVAVDFRNGVFKGHDYSPGQLGWNNWNAYHEHAYFACEYFT